MKSNARMRALASFAAWYMSERSASICRGAFGRCTLTATSRPLGRVARCTWPIDAAASGVGSNAVKRRSTGWPSSSRIMRSTSSYGNGRTSSCRPRSSATMSGGTTSGRVESSCPNLTNVGPSSSSISRRCRPRAVPSIAGSPALRPSTAYPKPWRTATCAISLRRPRFRCFGLVATRSVVPPGVDVRHFGRQGGRAMKRQIVFIHGLWLSSASWENFERYFRERGHDVIAPEWPRKEGDVEQLRAKADQLKGLGITEIADHYDAIVRARPEPPILVGHSFGGLFAMMLLDRGLGAAGVALDPAPPKGILNLPLRQLRASALSLAKRWKRHGVVELTPAQFTYGFMNTFPPDEPREAYERYAVPDTVRPPFEAAAANFNPRAANKVDFA